MTLSLNPFEVVVCFLSMRIIDLVVFYTLLQLQLPCKNRFLKIDTGKTPFRTFYTLSLDNHSKSRYLCLRDLFIIYDISPYLFGGVWILIGFVENPKLVFEAWVYSEVNNANQVVSYEVRSVALSETITDFTKEQLLQSIQAHPELKLW
ncbi:MAG: hypothetical protein IKZ12_00400 [Alistipes sp.]|nr:hypothetical protein [Alistipes sp.]